MPQTKIGNYLFSRLRELGIKTVFGVPGDYELAMLDLIGEAGVEFRGNPNELVASYAADGYARINGSGALVTTFGPGELSCYCGHAGAYAEFVPIAHIVGYPSREAIHTGPIMHHTLGTGEFLMYHEMAKHISADTAILMDPKTAPEEIDRCLNSMVRESRPVYIGVPVDMSHEICSDERLQTPLTTELPKNDPQMEKKVVAQIRNRMENKEYPIILVDGNAIRSDVVEESKNLSRITGLPTITTAMGKGGVDERAANFGGVYFGAGSHDGVKQAVERSDSVIAIGYYPSDFNTGEFTSAITPEVTIDLQRFYVKVGSQKFDVGMKYVLQALIKDIEQKPLSRVASKVDWSPYPLNDPKKDTVLTQDYLWPTFGKFLRDGDLIITETGTSAFGACDAWLPSGAATYNQTVFGSIGYATGSAVGAFQAIKETGKYKRCILVTGEGSLHLTVQAFADLLKLELHPIIFVLNNDGYTIERLIHGKDAAYNKLPYWDYSVLAQAFGPSYPSKYFGPVGTAEELDRVLASDDLQTECFRLVELKLGYLDAPAAVRKAAAGVEEFNSKKKQGLHGQVAPGA